MEERDSTFILSCVELGMVLFGSRRLAFVNTST